MENARFIILSFIIVASNAHSQVVSGATTVEQIYSYTTAGAGDMLIIPKDPLPECDGFWLDNEDPGFQGSLSVALSAYHAQSPVQLYGDEADLFNGSSSKFCKLSVLRLLKK